MAVGSDGSWAVSSGADAAVKVWDLAANPEALVRHGSGALVACFSPDGTRIAVGAKSGGVSLWDASHVAAPPIKAASVQMIECVAFSPDGTRVVSGGTDGTVEVWDASTGDQTLVLRGHADGVPAVGFLLDGDRVVSASWDGSCM